MSHFDSLKRKSSFDQSEDIVIDENILLQKRIKSGENREISNPVVIPYIKRIPAISDRDNQSFDVDFNIVNKVLRELEFVRRSRKAASGTIGTNANFSANNNQFLMPSYEPLHRDECPP